MKRMLPLLICLIIYSSGFAIAQNSITGEKLPSKGTDSSRLTVSESDIVNKAENDSVESDIAQIIAGKWDYATADDVKSILSRTQMAVFLEEVKYQLTYAKDACQSAKWPNDNLDSFKDTEEWIRILEHYPYLLSANVGFYDALRRVHTILFIRLCNQKDTFYPIILRMTPLLNKEAGHLYDLSFIYSGSQLERAVRSKKINGDTSK